MLWEIISAGRTIADLITRFDQSEGTNTTANQLREVRQGLEDLSVVISKQHRTILWLIVLLVVSLFLVGFCLYSLWKAHLLPWS